MIIRAGLLILALVVSSGAVAQQPLTLDRERERERVLDGGSRPVPDPTVLTTQQLFREIESLKENQRQMDIALREFFQTQIDALNRAAEIRMQTVEERRIATIEDMRAMVSAGITALRALQDEKFASIEKQFVERDIRTEQAAIQSKTAIDAALQAQKEAVAEQNRSSSEAVAKSERDTTKQIDSIVALIQTTASASSDKIDDTKSRLTILEGQRQGSVAVYSGIGIAIGLAIGLAGLVFTLTRGRPEPQVVYVPTAPNGAIVTQKAAA